MERNGQQCLCLELFFWTRNVAHPYPSTYATRPPELLQQIVCCSRFHHLQCLVSRLYLYAAHGGSGKVMKAWWPLCCWTLDQLWEVKINYWLVMLFESGIIVSDQRGILTEIMNYLLSMPAVFTNSFHHDGIHCNSHQRNCSGSIAWSVACLSLQAFCWYELWH